MREKDELDLLLDSALSTYADPGPHFGLEDRVLAALATTRLADNRPVTSPSPRRRWLPWTIAIPVAASLLILWFSTMRRDHLPPSTPQQARQSQPPPIKPSIHEFRPRAAYSENRAARSVPPPSLSVQTAAAEPLPKLDFFPTPQPLTPQEQALAVIATQTPAPELKALIDAQKADDRPFPIAASHIPPFEPPDEGANDRQ